MNKRDRIAYRVYRVGFAAASLLALAVSMGAARKFT